MTKLHLKNTKFNQAQKFYLCKQSPEAGSSHPSFHSAFKDLLSNLSSS